MTTPLKMQLLAMASGNATLSGLLGAGSNGVYPRAAADAGIDTTTPFVLLTIGNEAATDSLTARQFFTWWVYDDPIDGWGYWRVDRIALRLRRIFEGAETLTFDGRNWGRIEYDGTSEEITDDAWRKLAKQVRFSVHRV
jgi:hypothetical protein